jgi:hypothetical protein
MNGEPIMKEHESKYMSILMDYIIARKTDYYANVPSRTENDN